MSTKLPILSLRLILLYTIENYCVLSEVRKTRNTKINPHTKVAAMPWEEKFEADKKLVEELKVEWKKMWSERFDDKIRAEGVSVNNYNILKVDQGTIIHATRDFKQLNFKDILKDQKVNQPDRFIAPSVVEGGWHKFIKTKISNKKSCPIDKSFLSKEKLVGQQPKKCGRGWIHKA